MISLVCTKCRTILNVDDGFAGGVCRCSACGTIQTVPPKAHVAHASPQAIFERQGIADGAAGARKNGAATSDLEQLGEAVTSSGLIGSGMLQQSRRPRGTQAAAPMSPARQWWPIVLTAGASLLLIAGVGVGLWLGSNHGSAADASRANSSRSDAPAAANAPKDSTPVPAVGARRERAPSFGSITLLPAAGSGPVVYLLDRGDATRAYTAQLQRAVVRSLATLGSTRKFQVRYWTSDGESPAFPAAGPSEATPVTIAKVLPWMDEVPGGRATDAIESLNAALAARPAEIVLITGKGWQLDEGFANEAALKAGKTKVHTVALGGSAGSDALARLSARTGGTAIELDEVALTRLGQ